MKPKIPIDTNLGSLLANQDRFEEAEASWRKAVIVNPNFALAYLNLGLLLSDQNRVTEANRMIKKAIQLDPSIERYLQ
jgi:tetratricopeptide (TPR) repeat protein